MDDHIHSTNELLTALRNRLGCQSDYQLADQMGWTTSRLGNYRSGRARPTDYVAAQIAELLDLPAEYVVACIKVEREQNAQLKAMWRRIARMAKNAGKAACVAGVLALGGAGVPDARAGASESHFTDLYIMRITLGADVTLWYSQSRCAVRP